MARVAAQGPSFSVHDGETLFIEHEQIGDFPFGSLSALRDQVGESEGDALRTIGKAKHGGRLRDKIASFLPRLICPVPYHYFGISETRQPIDPARFSGNRIIWLTVSA